MINIDKDSNRKEKKMIKCFWDGEKMIHIFTKTGKYSHCIRCECGEKDLDVFNFDYPSRKMTFSKIKYSNYHQIK